MKKIASLIILVALCAVAVAILPLEVRWATPKAEALHEENVTLLGAALDNLIGAAKDAKCVVRRWNDAQVDVVLPAQTKADYLVAINAKAAAITVAYDAAVAVFVATEPIPEPEGEG